MDTRARASLTYRILTEVLGLALVLGAFSLSWVQDYTVATLIRNVALYVVIFAVIIVIWRRLGSMFDLGILGGKVSAMIGMVIALNIALAPVFLKILISDHEATRAFAASLLAAGFGFTMLLLMFLVRRSHAYKSKAHWRMVHHTLLITGGIFLLSLLVPMSFKPFADIPGRFLFWAVALLIMPLVQRVGSSMVANPAQPQKTQPAAVASSSNAPASSPSFRSSDHDEDDGRGARERDSHDRPPRRHRSRFRRHAGPSRRRM
ncbi:MAG: hypothetical protein ONB46_03705 [candidate division KSB1 bacterium]|nr:hypothetical protein [candidate division KSB1 bacterium]MDZ7364974.1 hypothetical protein [candidate division KSB1 bacterium]MDZ7403369.1 hypothetical protein [candidate division KSB1 bacterium]